MLTGLKCPREYDGKNVGDGWDCDSGSDMNMYEREIDSSRSGGAPYGGVVRVVPGLVAVLRHSIPYSSHTHLSLILHLVPANPFQLKL